MNSSGASGLAAAYQVAAETHEYMGTDLSEPIDVYGAIDKAGLLLAFTPFDLLLGMCLPAQRGVLVTTERPRTVQRFTAAHELGHCIMHNATVVLDGEMEITGATGTERELQAQMFAAYFLMPPDLAHNVAARHGIAQDSVSPAQIYLAARDMGSSYEATAFHLSKLGRVPPSRLTALLRAQRRAKRDSAWGVAPVHAAADVWPVQATSESSSVRVTVGDEVVIKLPENRSTGYRWEARTSSPRGPVSRLQQNPQVAGDSALSTWAAIVPAAQSAIEGLAAKVPDIVLDVYRSPNATARPVGTRRERRKNVSAADHGNGPIVGGNGERLIGCVPESPGAVHLDLVLRRPHDLRHDFAAEWSIDVQVLPSSADQRVAQVLATDIDQQLDEDPPDDLSYVVEPS